MFLEMRVLVRAMPLIVTKNDFTKAIVEENVLEKPTLISRKKSLRHLMELYGMDPSKALFRVLWDLGHSDLDSLPQLCLVCQGAPGPARDQTGCGGARGYGKRPGSPENHFFPEKNQNAEDERDPRKRPAARPRRRNQDRAQGI
jgi:hypothetical protein